MAPLGLDLLGHIQVPQKLPCHIDHRNRNKEEKNEKGENIHLHTTTWESGIYSSADRAVSKITTPKGK